MENVRVRTESVDGRTYLTDLHVRDHALTADEPADDGGDDLGPTPMELALLALASCASITLEMYAKRKGWPLEHVAIDVDRVVEEGPSGRRTRITRRIRLDGPLGAEERERLMEIAGRCPVARLITGETAIVDEAVEPAP